MHKMQNTAWINKLKIRCNGNIYVDCKVLIIIHHDLNYCPSKIIDKVKY